MRTKKEVMALFLARYPKFKVEKGEADIEPVGPGVVDKKDLCSGSLELGRYAREDLGDTIAEVGKVKAVTGTYRLVKTHYGASSDLFKKAGLTEEEHDYYTDDFDFEVVLDPREKLDQWTEPNWHILLRKEK